MTDDDRSKERANWLRAAARHAMDSLRRYVITLSSGAIGLSMVLAQTSDAWGRSDELQGIWLAYGIAIVIAMVSLFTEVLIYATQAAAVEQQRDANSGIGLGLAIALWSLLSVAYIASFSIATFRLIDFAVSLAGR